MMTFEEFINLPESEKVTIVVTESVRQAKIFQYDDILDCFKRSVSFFVSGVKDGESEYTLANSKILSESEYFFESETLTLYIKPPGIAVEPKQRDISIRYKHFFADAPFNLPHDFENGYDIEFEGRVIQIGAIGSQLDEENTGIVLESSSTVDLNNRDGYFDDIYDTHIWENSPISFYKWSPLIPLSMAQRIFTGVIENKNYGDDKITFRVKDFVFKLQNTCDLKEFSSDDGTVLDAYLGTPKRRIYGQAKQIMCVGTDAIIEGITPEGTLTCTGATKNVSGTGTSFLSYLSPGDDIYIQLADEEIKLTVDIVNSNTSFSVSSDIDESWLNLPFRLRPAGSMRTKNRTWNIAGHKLREPNCVVEGILSGNRFIVDSTKDIFAGDLIKYGSDLVRVRRISGNQLVLEVNITPLPAIGSVFTKSPVSTLYVGKERFIEDRDFEIENNVNDAVIRFNNLAEFNVAKERSLSTSMAFTSGSRSVTTTANVDLRTIFSTNDWIKRDSLTNTTWAEILSVEEKTITLRTPFPDTTTGSVLYKKIDGIIDESVVTVNCMGLEIDIDGVPTWVKTPSDTVNHLLKYDARFSAINNESFAKANAECNFIMSLFIPEDLGSSSPKIKDVITLVNESVFGSVYQNRSSEICFSVLNSKKPEDLLALQDDDIIDFKSSTDNQIVNRVKINYRKFTDIYSGSPSNEIINLESKFVDNLIGIEKEEERDIYLYEDDKALIIAQRIRFFKSLSVAQVTVQSKLNLSNKNVNDKMYLSLDRLYKRYGGMTKKKIGVISGIRLSGNNTEITFVDLGNVFNRVPSIAPNSEIDYLTSTDENKVKWGYILDNDTLTPDPVSENELGNNLIG